MEEAIEPGAQVPAKLTKLANAMQTVGENVKSIEALAPTIAELERTHSKTTAYDLTTKAGWKLADDGRKLARKTRLDIQNLWKDGKALLNGLKDQLKDAAEGDIVRLEAIENNAKSQLDAHAQKEEDRKQCHKNNITAINRLSEGLAFASSALVAERIAALGAIVVDESYEEFEADAKTAKTNVLEIMESCLASAKQREEEAEAQRLKDLRRQEIEARLDSIRKLPEQVEGTGDENILKMIDVWQTRVDADDGFPVFEFGDQALAAFGLAIKAIAAMRKMLTPAPAPAAPSPAPAPRVEGGIPDVATHGEPATSTPVALEAPFDDKTGGGVVDHSTQRAATEVVTTTRKPIPARRPSPAPAPVAAPAPASVDKVEVEVPDLLQAAKTVIAEYDRSPHSLGDETHAMTIALENLRAAIALVDEFAD